MSPILPLRSHSFWSLLMDKSIWQGPPNPTLPPPSLHSWIVFYWTVFSLPLKRSKDFRKKQQLLKGTNRIPIFSPLLTLQIRHSGSGCVIQSR